MFLLMISKQHHFPNNFGHRTSNISFFSLYMPTIETMLREMVKITQLPFHKRIFYKYLKFS